MLKAVLFDLSGVLYQDQQLLHGAVEALQTLRRQPLALRFVTNTSRQTSEQLLQRLNGMGLEVRREELFTAAGAVLAYLQRHGYTAYPLVHPNLDEEFAPYTSTSPDVVVVADAGERFDYAHLNRAFSHLMTGAELIAIGDNRYFRSDGELLLDAGPFIHALAYAADKQPVVIGKPSATFFTIVLDSAACSAAETLMIGDDVIGDVEGALRAGLQACLVQTGKYQLGDEKRCALPGLQLARDVGEIVATLIDRQ